MAFMSEGAENRQRPIEDVHPKVKGWSYLGDYY